MGRTPKRDSPERASKVTDPIPAPALETKTVPRRDWPILFEGVQVPTDYRFTNASKWGNVGTSIKRRIRRFCVVADSKQEGNAQVLRCLYGKEILTDPMTADIDHLNDDEADNRACNLALACSSHNSQEWNRRRRAIPASGGSKREIQGAGAVGVGQSIEAKIWNRSARNEPAFRAFYFERVITDHKAGKVSNPDLLRKEARNWTGCSRASSYSYEERLINPTKTSGNAPLDVEQEFTTGEMYLVFRDKACYRMTVQQIEAKYPTNGIMSLRRPGE